jgi:protein-disulfide isomerase
MLGRLSKFALVLALSAGCERGGTSIPIESPHARAEDAAGLPGFDGDDEPRVVDEIERFYVPLGDAPTRGPDTAGVTVVMFSDFECPFCQRGHDTLLELARRHPDDVRIAYKAYPLDRHSLALLAAMAARTAQAQGKFWEFHDLLYSGRELSVPVLFQFAERTGVDVEQMRRDLADLEYGPEVRRDLRLARRIGVDSTPSFFINGRPISGAQPLEVFEPIIAQELKLAEQWRAEGVAPTALYEHAIADGFRKVVFTQGRRSLDPDAVMPVPIDGSPTRGRADAPITLVAFGDFQCPYCARGNATVEALRQEYGDKLRVVFKHFPLSFHSHAFLAARAAEAAKVQGKFWEFHDALYDEDAQFDEDDLHAIAKRIGLDTKAFRKAMASTDLDWAITRDQNMAGELGVTGTPAFFINGRPLEGAQPELEFRLLFAEELQRAAHARAQGVAPADLYETLSQTPLTD